MSKDFKPAEKISMTKLFGGRLEQFGVREHFEPEPWDELLRILTDGFNYLLVYETDDGNADLLTSKSWNDPEGILNAVALAFNIDIYTEDDPQFWGFHTQAEFDQYMNNRHVQR